MSLDRYLQSGHLGRALFDGTPAPVALTRVTADGLVVLGVNQAAIDGTGWARDDLSETALRALLPAPLAARLEDAVAVLQEPGDRTRFEVQLEVPAGRRVYDVTAIELEPLDGHRHVVSISVDVTEQRRIEEALGETQTLARIGHWSWDLSNDQLWCTDQVAHIYGLVPADGPTDVERFWGQVLPEDEPELRDLIGAAVEARSSFEAEYRVRGWGHEPRVVHTHGMTVADEHGEPLRIAGTVQDVTDERAAQQLIHLAGEATERQRRALEMNDGIVQGLATARLALMLEDDPREVMQVIDDTIAIARAIVADLLGARMAHELAPGDLVRFGPVQTTMVDCDGPA